MTTLESAQVQIQNVGRGSRLPHHAGSFLRTMTTNEIERFKSETWPDWLCWQFKGWMCSKTQSAEIQREVAVFLRYTRENSPERFGAAFPQRDWSAQDDSLSPFDPPDEKKTCSDKTQSAI